MIKNKTLLTIAICSVLAACASTSPQKPTKDAEEIKSETLPVQTVEKPAENQTDTQPQTLAKETEAKEDVISQKTEPAPVVKPTPEPKPLLVKTSEGKLVMGLEEWVYVPGLNQNFKAKIDSGATTSSVSATDIVRFERDGKDWVKFRVHHGKILSKEISLPVTRWAKVKQSNSTEVQKRPVVTSWVQVGDLKEKTDFTLTDRNHLSTPLLLGQSFVRDVAIIDTSRSFVQSKVTIKK